MVILLKDHADQRQVDNLVAWLKAMGFDVHMSVGSHQTLLGLIGDTSTVDIDVLKSLEIVENVKRIQEPYKNANRKFHEEDTVVDCGAGVKIGGGNFQIIAGPCSVESLEQITYVAKRAGEAGAAFARRRFQAPRTAASTLPVACTPRALTCCSRPSAKPGCPSSPKSWTWPRCPCSRMWT